MAGLIIFCEGQDDQTFVERILKPYFKNGFGYVGCIQYRGRTKKDTNNLISRLHGAGYQILFLVDHDNSRCIRETIQKILNIYTELKKASIIVVQKSIEAWYCAGATKNICNKYSIPERTETIDKSKFRRLCKQHRSTSLILMQEILNNYSIEQALCRNTSFARIKKLCK
ncbi:MAG TPA: hypothetical protein VNK96_01900 [Fimbriimonadales bacterium]|nr:hypothetical protein [Fimbriimonadales bacterium]